MIGPAHPDFEGSIEEQLLHEATKSLNKTIISAVGYARTGKDEFSKIAVEEFGYTRFAFADKLRECLEALNPIIHPAHAGWDNDGAAAPITVRLSEALRMYGWDGYKSSPYSDEIRALLQRFGTEVGRDLIDRDIWLRELDKVKADKIIITDTRFPNELDYVVAKGGKIVRIHRPGYGPINDHISEVAIDDYEPNFKINNSSTLEEYANNIRGVIQSIESQ